MKENVMSEVVMKPIPGSDQSIQDAKEKMRTWLDRYENKMTGLEQCSYHAAVMIQQTVQNLFTPVSTKSIASFVPDLARAKALLNVLQDLATMQVAYSALGYLNDVAKIDSKVAMAILSLTNTDRERIIEVLKGEIAKAEDAQNSS